MKKLYFSTHINAPRKHVWHTMLDDKTYREWTEVFHKGSYFKGSWEEGSEIRFIGPDEEGKDQGMLSQIEKSIPFEFISIKHVGIIKDGVEDRTSEEAKKWTPAFENYRFMDKDGGTEVMVEMDSDEGYADMFTDMWPRALAKLKEIAEKK